LKLHDGLIDAQKDTGNAHLLAKKQQKHEI